MQQKCKIIIKDEVNCKIEGLDLADRKELVRKFKYEDPTARFRPSFKLGRWDGTVSFFGLGGTTYLSMLPRVIEILVNKNYSIDIEDLRLTESLQFNHISVDYWGDKTWPEGHRFEGQPIRLREDQVDVINKFLENPQCLQEIATGFGKTITNATLAHICEKYGKTITIVPNKSLVEQTEENFLICGLDVGVFYGDRKDLTKTHTICTWQSLNVLDKNSHDSIEDKIKLTEFISEIKTVIVDEVHLATATILKKLLTENFANVPIRWGLTGTIPKQDFEYESLRASIGDVVNKITAKELQDKGILSNCHVNIIQTAEWKEFKHYQDELKFLLNDESRLNFIFSILKDINDSGNTLVLVDRLDSGKFLQEKFNNYYKQIGENIEVPFISGIVKTSDRKSEYKEVATSSNKLIIATYGVASTGIDIPRIFNLVLIEPGKSFTRVIQSIGRGIRKAEDKDFVQIYDICASTKYSKQHLTTRKKFYNEAKYPFTIAKSKYI